MRALLLVGGKATRLRPLTTTMPKAMTPLLGRPFLEYVLAWLRRHDIADVTLLLGHLPGPIRAHFGDGAAFGVRLRYLVEETPLGSGGAIKQLDAELTDPFLVLNGDIFTDLDLETMAAAHRAAGAEVTIALVPVEDPSAYGVAAVGRGGWITRFVEKPPEGTAPSNLVNAGAWLFQPSALHRIPSGRFSMVEQELFPELAAKRRLLGYAAPCYWMDAGTTSRYLQLHRDLLTGRAASALPLGERSGWPGLGIGGPAGTPPEVDPAGRLDGPVVLGAGTRVGAGAVVRGPASIGAGVVLDTEAVVADSVLWDGGHIAAGARVTSSILASGCIVGAGAHVEGSVLGDGVRVRPGAVVVNTSVEPGETVG